jgi:hypothetical protein
LNSDINLQNNEKKHKKNKKIKKNKKEAKNQEITRKINYLKNMNFHIFKKSKIIINYA